MASIIEIAGCRALNAWKLERTGHQSAPLHSDADNSEAHSVARSYHLRQGPGGSGIQQNCPAGNGCACSRGGERQKTAAGESAHEEPSRLGKLNEFIAGGAWTEERVSRQGRRDPPHE